MTKHILAFPLAGVITFLICLWLVPRLRASRLKKDVREDVPERHKQKAGTPSMGGIAFVFGALAAALALCPSDTLGQGQVGLLSGTLVTFAIMGFWDDLRKGKGGRGLKARYKLLWQTGWALFFVFFAPVSLVSPWDWLFAVLLVAVSSNAVNLTDGLDGLAAGLSLVAALAIGVMALLDGQDGICTFCFALAGAMAGFLPFNAHPAKVFMGDTGSVSLGAALAMAAILARFEFWWLLIGLVFFVDMMTVVVQVAYFQTTKRIYGEGKRIFPITPIHHAFELKGWSEWEVVGTFWAAGAICGAAGGGLWWATR